MQNEELIKAARAEANCKQCEGCGSCPMPHKENPSCQRMCVDFDEEVLPQLCDALEAADKAQRWISVSERLPENQKRVLVCGLSNYNHTSRTMFKAEYIRKMTVTADDYGWSEDCDYDYDEEKDENYVPEGWYESIMNWDEYSSVAVTDFTVTHWMPLPEPPQKGE